jgi:uncharacterized protein (DUF3084 family)
MTSAYILVAAMLVLGGLIAALGDRLGSKVGKARLRLFNLRPRQTAQVVTIATGTLIAASTLVILFTLSKSLRQGLFELDEILRQQRLVKEELVRVKREKERTEQELLVAQNEQTTVAKRLKDLNQNFARAQTKLKAVSKQAKLLRDDIKTLLTERQQLVEQKNDLDRQITQLQEKVQVKDRELTKQNRQIAEQNKILEERKNRLQELEKQQELLQAKISEQDNLIGKLDKAIADKDDNLKKREEQLKELESQQAFLKKEIDVLEQYYQTYQELRERRIAIVRGQVLALATVRVVDPDAVIDAIDQLLRQANRNAIAATRPGKENLQERVVQITKAQVEELINRIKDGRDYVVRIISAGNYVQGENEVRVFADVSPNQKIFNRDETIATISLDSLNLTEEDFQKRLDILLAASQFSARRAGILGNIQVEDGSIKTIFNFLEQLSQSQEIPDEIKAIASENTYTAGPLKLRLIAIKDGKIILSTEIIA